MDQFKRDQILGEITGCTLSAEVASSARNSDICEYLSNIIDELHLSREIKIEPMHKALSVTMPRIKMSIKSDESCEYSMYFCLRFDDDHDAVLPNLDVENLAYQTFYAGSTACMMLKAMNAIAEKLDEIRVYVNSDRFKSYKNDIKALVDVKARLEQFDKDMHEEKIKQTVLSFHAGQVLKVKCGKTHLIRKVTRKRLWLSDWHYYNGAVKQSEDKELIARSIVNGQYSICV